MGFYLNPTGVTREQFLAKHAMLITEEQFKAFVYSDEQTMMPICLVENRSFQAAGVAFNPRERDMMAAREHEGIPDPRPRTYWLLPMNVLDEGLGPQRAKELKEAMARE